MDIYDIYFSSISNFDEVSFHGLTNIIKIKLWVPYPQIRIRFMSLYSKEVVVSSWLMALQGASG